MLNKEIYAKYIFQMTIFIYLASCLEAFSARLAKADDSDLAKQLSNPVAALISVPLKYDYNANLGPNRDGVSTSVTVQPVIPISLGDDWNLISRTIIPYVTNDAKVNPLVGKQSGFGDVTQSFFFSPKEPTVNGLIWGLGPLFQIPTFSDVSTDTWGAGITGLILKQESGWTYGALAGHLWDINGNIDINVTTLQPFISYSTPTAWTFGLNAESSYNWVSEDWSVPINATVSKLVKFGNQLVSLQAGVRYWATSPDFGPEDLGFRLQATFLFPK